MRSTVFKNIPPQELNRVIIAFESFYVQHKVTIDNNLYEGFIICLEG